MAAIAELDYTAFLARQAGNEPQLVQQTIECPQCGARTTLDPNVVGGRCAFCATPLVATRATSERQIQPRALVPFAIERRAAQDVFLKWIAGRWFAPNALQKSVRSLQGVRGVYLPCWTFDAHSTSSYAGMRGIDRIVSEQGTDSQGNRRTVHRTVTDWYPASGVVALTFDDRLVPASSSIPPKLAEVLRSWDIGALVPWAPEYLAGFTVEAYQLGLEPAFAQAKASWDDAIHEAVRADIGGNHQQVHHIDTALDSITFKHILLPVWICSYLFNGRSWQVVVNGQSGEVRGDRPWSPWKIGSAVVAALAVAFVLYLLFGQH